jgi:hypothetical protein
MWLDMVFWAWAIVLPHKFLLHLAQPQTEDWTGSHQTAAGIMTLTASLSLEGASQMNQQFSWSHVQNYVGRSGHIEHLRDHVPTCP